MDSVPNHVRAANEDEQEAFKILGTGRPNHEGKGQHNARNGQKDCFRVKPKYYKQYSEQHSKKYNAQNLLERCIDL